MGKRILKFEFRYCIVFMFIPFLFIFFGCAGSGKRNTIRKPDKFTKPCRLVIISEVDGVDLNLSREKKGFIGSGTAARKLWTSTQGITKEFPVSCESCVLGLSKQFYPNKNIPLDFSKKNEFSLVLKKDDWMKYGFIRIENNSQNGKSIELRKLFSNPVKIPGGTNFVRKLEIGEYPLEISAQFKIPQQKKIKLASENEIFLLRVSTEEHQKDINILAGNEVVLKHGSGFLRLLTEKSNVEAGIASIGWTEPVRKTLHVPAAVTLPSGYYQIEFHGTTKNIQIVNGKETLVNLIPPNGIKVEYGVSVPQDKVLSDTFHPVSEETIDEPGEVKILQLTTPFMRGSEVRRLQKFLQEKGYLHNVDGVFGKGTMDAVKRFQKAHGIPDSGKVDAETRKVMEKQ